MSKHKINYKQTNKNKTKRQKLSFYLHLIAMRCAPIAARRAGISSCMRGMRGSITGLSYEQNK